MSVVTFLHAADLHLDTPFVGLAEVRPEVAQALRDASLEAWDRLVAVARERQVDFVVLAGDVYDGPSRGIRAQLRFRKGLDRLAEAGIACFVVHGNHDPVEEGWSAIAHWPAGTHVFGAGAVTSVPVVRNGETIATVHGVSFGRRAEQENLARKFRRGTAGLQVGVLHCNADGQPGHDPYAPCSLADLLEAGMDYWALGHIHQRQELAPGIAYPGNLQGRSLRETGPRGALLVTVRGRSVVESEFVPLAPVEFASVELDVGGMEDLGAIEQAAVERVAALYRPGLEGLVVELRLVGATGLHRVLIQGAEELRRALDDTGAGKPFVHWSRVQVATRLPVDREALEARDDFAGELLRTLRALRVDPEAAGLWTGLDEPVARGNLARRVPAPTPAQREAILALVEALALERLAPEAEPSAEAVRLVAGGRS